MTCRVYKVAAAWDQEGHMWYVADSDVPGLNTEAATYDALVDRVTAIAPDLLALNGHDPGAKVSVTPLES
ncbi:MAG TPA: DUF1902 domain-containing protein [Azospirillaceae bacterium]|nr:DUF1902 domain-containing protein [Azospirillaceae bacterium]